jgi:Fe-S oxidoreductase
MAVRLLTPRCINGSSIHPVPCCCSEAGTMALSRPDITNSMLERKHSAASQIAENPGKKILTNCPSCMQGLGRHRDLKLEPVHLAQELALVTGGKHWKKTLKKFLEKSEVIPF